MLVSALAASASFSTVAAADDTGAWYVSPLAQWWHIDGNRDTTSHVDAQLGIGYNFAPNLSIELEGSGGTFATPGGHDLSLEKLSVDVLNRYLPDAPVHPYLIFGAGAITDHLTGAPQLGALELEGGGGLLVDLGPKIRNTRWQARAEVKYQHLFSDTSVIDTAGIGAVVYSLGVQYSFGIPNPPPPPAPPAAPPPPPPVAAAPPPPPPPPVDGDDDGDGVPNSIDKCPNTPKGDKVDAFGCTITPEIKLEGVNFATASAELTPESDYVLQYAVKTLKRYPELVVEIAGYTDSRGTVPYNVTLSQHRAESVKRYLEEHGVTNKLSAKGYGKEHPIASNETKEGQLENRRVTMRIIGGL
jgi:OOP family OmpA-OmpF porin